MTTPILTPSHTLDLTPKKKARRGKYDQEAIDTLLAKAENLPEEMTPAMEEAVRKYEEKQRETAEKKEKSLEFEEDTFKIDSTGWKETTQIDKKDPILGKFVGKEPKIKVNSTGDVIEYLEGPAKGEQLFIGYDAFIRELCKAKNCSQEEAEKKYLMTSEEFKQKMKDKPANSEEYKKFFNKEVKGKLAGYWNPNLKEFNDIGIRSDVWLVGGIYAGFSNIEWNGNYLNRDFGFSGRLLKN